LFVGCTSDASEPAARAGGDDVAFNAAMAPMLNAPPGEGMRYFVRQLAEDLALHRRAGRVLEAMADPGMSRPTQFEAIAAPTLLLAGSESPPVVSEATQRAAATIP
jgi:hypothetical protein